MNRRFSFVPIAIIILGTSVISFAEPMAVSPAALVALPQFDLATSPPAPDYSQKTAWAADGGDAGSGPAGVTEQYPESRKADVFFIHPTTYFSANDWNQPIDDAATNARTDSGPIRNQASAFDLCCRVYAPRYRQMSLNGFLNPSAGSKAAMDLAYSDVKRAFEYFIAHYNHGRPFIIAAHSQGSRHARRLIEEEIGGAPLRKQLVAAYLVGNWIEVGWFTKLGTIQPCDRANDTGCVLSWNTLIEGADAQRQRVDFARRSDLPLASSNQAFLCINPLNWTRSTELVGSSFDIGGWVYGRGSRPRPFDPHLVSARCDDGALFVSEPAGLVYRIAALPGGNYHNYDYQLAYMNIRENAKTRVDAFLASQR